MACKRFWTSLIIFTLFLIGIVSAGTPPITIGASYLQVNETDPYWTGNFTLYNTTWSSTYNATYNAYNSTGLIRDWNATGYIKNWDPNNYIKDWNSTGFIKNWIIDIISANTSLKDWIDAQNYLTSYTESDPYWTGNQSSYFNTTDILGFSYWNSTFATFNKTYADTLYYGITNPYSYWNSTFATFNKTYADTLYSTISEPLWTGNSTLVPYLASANVFTANQNLTGINISAMDCIIFDSGGKICSGV